MKKLCALFCMVAVILSIVSTSAFAAEPEGKVTDLGDGFYLVETLTQYPMGRSGDTPEGTVSGNVYYGSKLIGTATLTAAFDISGSSARVTKAVIEGTGKNGGEYLGGKVNRSGNTASGTANFGYNGGEKSVMLSISCSPDGRLS